MMTVIRGLKVLLPVIPAKAGIQSPSDFLELASPSKRLRLARTTLLKQIILLCWLVWASLIHAAVAPDLEDQTRALATELRCVVCQNLSVADSPSEMAQQMRAIVREQLQAGKTPEQVKDFFVSKYGEWVLLKPKTSGFGLLLWLLPYVGLTLGVITALWFVRRWARRKTLAAQSPVSGGMERIRSEIARERMEQPDSEDTSPRAELLR